MAALVGHDGGEDVTVEGIGGRDHPEVGIVVAIAVAGGALRTPDRRRCGPAAVRNAVDQEGGRARAARRIEIVLLGGGVEHVAAIAGAAEGRDVRRAGDPRTARPVEGTLAALEEPIRALRRVIDRRLPEGEVAARTGVDQVDVHIPAQLVEIDRWAGSSATRSDPPERQHEQECVKRGAAKSHRASPVGAPCASARLTIP